MTIQRPSIRTCATLRRKLRALLKETDKQLTAHIKEWGECYSSCQEGSQLRQRIEDLKEVITLTGGRA